LQIHALPAIRLGLHADADEKRRVGQRHERQRHAAQRVDGGDARCRAFDRIFDRRAYRRYW